MRNKKFRYLLLVLLTAMSVLLLCFVLYLPHLLWKLSEWRLGLTETKGLPYSECVSTTIPQDWEEVVFGSVRISLPKELADSIVTVESSQATIHVQLQGLNIYLTDTSTSRPFWAFSTAFAELDSGPILTAPQIRFECFRRSSNEFSWAMSFNEVRRHSFFIVWGQIGRGEFNRIETCFGTLFDKIILFGAHQAAIDFQSLDQSVEGQVVFYDEHREIDHKLVRQICNSIELYSVQENPMNNVDSGE